MSLRPGRSSIARLAFACFCLASASCVGTPDAVREAPPPVRQDAWAAFPLTPSGEERALPSKVDWLNRHAQSPEMDIDLVEAATVIANSRLEASVSYSSIPSVLRPYLLRARARCQPITLVEEKIRILNEDVLPAIRRAIEKELRWLHDVYGSDEGDCLPGSLLYLVAADSLSLHLDAVIIPRHVFVCHSGAGGVGRTVETTKSGEQLTRERYAGYMSLGSSDMEKVPQEPTALAKQLTPITRRQLVSLLLCNAAQTGEPGGRRKRLEEAVRFTPDFYVPHKLLAQLYQRQDEWAKAELELTQAIGLATHVPALFAARWGCRVALKNFEAAIADAEAAIRLAPKHPMYHYLAGVANMEAKRYDEAIEEHTRALDLDPRFDWPWEGRAQVYEMTKRYAEAAADLGKAIALKPTSAEYYRRRAKMWAMLGDEAHWDADTRKAKELEEHQ